MALKLVKPGEPLPEDETRAERIERAKDACTAIMAAAEADGDFWCLVSGNDDMHVYFLGDALEMACITEEVARRLKLAEIGFGD
ncbi:hypothetical protein [Pseudoxanthomonas sp. CF125]|uniref:hypothetical protein n=1 Tax=Pseudoxanthomonas sp. CF125 TaxID=1855303 RepID=UPI000881B789|nr:hypothetical protein [Pseudoxanthomonas sp. CF125]SDQ42605.1 hypothetical protein SAMN05216569_1079 [Pseudoxanthomonas sp. CF125]